MSARPGRPSFLVPCLAGAAQAAIFINHAPLIPLIMRDLGISPAEAGLLSTALFLAGGIAALPIGTLTDRLGPRRVMSIAIAVLAASTLALAAAPTFAAMLAIKLGSGMTATAMFIAGGHYANAVWEGEDRPLAQGLYGGSIQLGIGAAIFLLPAVAARVGWRGALALCAVPALVAWAVWQAAARSVPPATADRGRVGRVLRDPAIWALGSANGATFGLGIVLGTWVTVYFAHEFALPLTLAGPVGSVAMLLGMLGRPLGGVLLARGLVEARRFIRVTLLACTAGVLLMAWPGRPLAAALLGVVVVGVATSLSYAAVIVLAARARPDAPGAALGLIGTISTSTIVVGAPLAGALLTASGDFAVPLAVLALLPAGALLACGTLPRG